MTTEVKNEKPKRPPMPDTLDRGNIVSRWADDNEKCGFMVFGTDGYAPIFSVAFRMDAHVLHPVDSIDGEDYILRIPRTAFIRPLGEHADGGEIK